ncbi:hypothetical protein PMIN01_03734 [Paraphaeosphaeria minitans]|uniref:Uncharacterized protein n=1 Tax=Paraphaeosphaeria minitans TaxID=565426 RepID=A0A9P6GND4_9PLEO|nr:hypothetical protein PMIN01_03734 [Paraphaeosphaeria minitans]
MPSLTRPMPMQLNGVWMASNMTCAYVSPTQPQWPAQRSNRAWAAQPSFPVSPTIVLALPHPDPLRALIRPAPHAPSASLANSYRAPSVRSRPRPRPNFCKLCTSQCISQCTFIECAVHFLRARLDGVCSAFPQSARSWRVQWTFTRHASPLTKTPPHRSSPRTFYRPPAVLVFSTRNPRPLLWHTCRTPRLA